MFNKHIIDFNKNILGLREFVDLIDPILKEKHKEDSEPIHKVIMSGMLKKDLAVKKEWKENEKEKLEALLVKIDSEILEKYKKQIEVEIITEKDGEEKGKVVNFKIKSSEEFDKHILNSNKSRMHIELLYKNALISLLSSVEWFFSEILHYYYDKFPESAGIQKKTMTLSDLKNFGSVRDAEKYLVDVKIEEVLRGNFESWVSILKTELSLKLGYINPIEDELIEIYQRRNLFVHNGGVVNSIYIAKVKEEYRKNIKLNGSIVVDKKYLDNVICKLQKAFILIASELWKKLDKNDKKRGDVLIDIVYENLLKSRWDICEGLCHFIINDSQLEPINKTVAQLNYWLCKKKTKQYNTVKEEINKTDYSDKKEIFQLALFALQDDNKSFFEILPFALDSGQLSIEKLEEFPIFEELRNTEEYSKFKLKSKYFKEPIKKADKSVTGSKTKPIANNLSKSKRKIVKKK